MSKPTSYNNLVRFHMLSICLTKSYIGHILNTIVLIGKTFNFKYTSCGIRIFLTKVESCVNMKEAMYQ